MAGVFKVFSSNTRQRTDGENLAIVLEIGVFKNVFA